MDWIEINKEIFVGAVYTRLFYKKSKEKEESRSVLSSKRFNAVHHISLWIEFVFVPQLHAEKGHSGTC